MEYLKKISLLSGLIFFVAGCGESFRSEQTTLNSDTTRVIDNGFRNSQTALSIDEQILMSYAGELQGQEASTRSLMNVIRAFDFAITPNTINGLMSLEAKVTFSCTNRLIFNREISLAQFQSGQVVSLGTNGQHSVRVQCTSSSCNEIVAAIRLTDNFNNATVLVGMAVNSRVDNSLVYLSRNVNLSSPFFAVFSSGSAYHQMNSCPAPVNTNLSVTDRIVNILQEEASNRIISEAESLLNRWFGQ